MPNTALESLIAMLRERPIDPEASWEQRRESMEAMQAQLELPAEVTLEPVTASGIPCEWIQGDGADQGCVVVYLHGGGYTLGSIASHRFLVQGIACAAKCRALAVDYRLAPENPFPAALDDAVAACHWLWEQGIASERTVIAGDSAGGGLALATLLALRDRGRESAQVAGAVMLSPWTDLTGSGDSLQSKAAEDPMVRAQTLHAMAAAYAPGATGDPLVSPLFGDLTGLPPLLVQVGTAEVLLDDSLRLAERAKAAGVDVDLEVWDEMIHVFQAFPMLEESARAIENIGSWVRQRT